MAQKMLVGDRDTVLLIPAYTVSGAPLMALPSTASGVPLSAPTAALLNYYIDITTPGDAGSSWGGNITCAILDDMNLAMADSATKNVRTLCSVGESEELTFYNFDAVMNFLRDVDPKASASEFNLPANLTSAPDVPYIIAHRIGYSRTEAAAVGQEWHFYYAWTDNSVPSASDGEYQGITQTFVKKGLINFKHELSS